ncbi:hypothetical protein L1987_07730 [Smallanthus sonchifolius]|uniref:Uncharacterized protein n=1 Tax=Smallanthus sonchifolius TaxID=185202 RepID=A0ACB9K136_9ASTR|nr:hypothetical protein L1987_07730 [Smallanthus sonchifolius]
MKSHSILICSLQEIDESMEDVGAMFHILFPDHDEDKSTETQEDESDPELAELFKDINEEANIPNKFI